MNLQRAIIKQYLERGTLAIPSSAIHAFLNKTMNSYDVEALLWVFYNEELISSYEVLTFDERKAERAKKFYNKNNKKTFQLLFGDDDITLLLFDARELKDIKIILKFLNVKYDEGSEGFIK